MNEMIDHSHNRISSSTSNSAHFVLEHIYTYIYIQVYISKINCISEQSLEKKKENTYISSADRLASRPRVHLEGSDAKLGMNVVNQRYFEGP